MQTQVKKDKSKIDNTNKPHIMNLIRYNRIQSDKYSKERGERRFKWNTGKKLI